ncbi:MAG TPA: GH25 family lysozyme [Polyangiaceae bacterium]|nr:GH25 family lysozyme [Polyangiaceae bacterium]
MKRGWILLCACGLGCSAAPGQDEETRTTSEALQQCATNVVEGIDIYDGTGTIDWKSVKAAGVDFAMIKATQGTYNTQSTFATNWSGSKAAGLYRSAYHFFDPTEDGAAQAQHFLSVLGTPQPDDMPAMLDIECPDGDANCLGTGASGQASASDIFTRMWAWIDAVQKATGKKPIVYTFGSYFSSNGIDTTGLPPYPLFIADPTGGANNCFNVPAPWTSAVIWQYSWTGTVSGISGQVDRDRFVGTLAQLGSFANPPTTGSDAGAKDASGGDAARDSGGTPGEDGGSPGPGEDSGPIGVPSGDGSTVSPDAASGGSSGCGCRTAGGGSSGGYAALAAVAALGLSCRRRRVAREG